MFRKSYFVPAVIFYAFIFAAFANISLADDVTSRLKQAYICNKWFVRQAERIYSKVIKDYPGTDYALEAQKQLIFQHIWAGRIDLAQMNTDKLTKYFTVHPDLPKVLYEIAKEYETAEDDTTIPSVEKYNAARGIYQQVIQRASASAYAGKARLDVPRIDVLLLIWSGKTGETTAAISNLTSSFTGNPNLSKALCGIALMYEKTGKYNEAKDLCQNVLVNFAADTDSALNAQKHLVLLSIAMKKDGDVKAALDKLAADFAGHKNLPFALYDIALKYEELGRYKEAQDVYQRVIQLAPASFRGQKAVLDIPKDQMLSDIDANDDSKVMPAVDKMIADFNSQPYLAVAVSRIADQYAEKARQLAKKGSVEQAKSCFQKAAAIYEIVINKLPESTSLSKTSGRLAELETATPKAYFEAGYCLRKAGDFEKSAEYYKKMIDVYPDFSNSWDAVFIIELDYNEMAKAGLISQAEAIERTRASYKQFLSEHPDSSLADLINGWLMRHIEDNTK